jgi:hypothetical protein
MMTWNQSLIDLLKIWASYNRTYTECGHLLREITYVLTILFLSSKNKPNLRAAPLHSAVRYLQLKFRFVTFHS